MKKALLFLFVSIVFLSAGGKLSAQDDPNEIYFGYGPGSLTAQSLYETTNDIVNGIVHEIFQHDQVNENSNSTGILLLGYNRYISEKLKLGFGASYVSYTNSLDYLENGEVKQHFKWSDSFITIMLRFDFHYLRKEKISLYSGLALGASFINSKNISGAEDLKLPQETLFAFQLNAFGIRFGKEFAFFLETGFGYNGLLNGGLSFQF